MNGLARRLSGALGLALCALVAAACLNAGTAGDPTPSPPAATGTADANGNGRVRVPAPIVDARIRIAESWPPQYFVDIVAGQPDGCHAFGDHGVERAADRITITVWNTVPEDLAVRACTAIYGETRTVVPLGSDFASGTVYTVQINALTLTFVAQ